MSIEENERMYQEKKRILSQEIDRFAIPMDGSVKALEIGCGTGYWTEFLAARGIKQYTGNDIAEVSVINLRKKYPQYTFLHGDISEIELPEQEYDIVLMLDVTQHITDDDRFVKGMSNVWGTVRSAGHFFVTMWDAQKNFYLATKLRLNRIEKPRDITWYQRVIEKNGRVISHVGFNDKDLLLVKKL